MKISEMNLQISSWHVFGFTKSKGTMITDIFKFHLLYCVQLVKGKDVVLSCDETSYHVVLFTSCLF